MRRGSGSSKAYLKEDKEIGSCLNLENGSCLILWRGFKMPEVFPMETNWIKLVKTCAMTNTMRHWLAERFHRCYCDRCTNRTGEINTSIYTNQGGK